MSMQASVFTNASMQPKSNKIDLNTSCSVQRGCILSECEESSCTCEGHQLDFGAVPEPYLHMEIQPEGAVGNLSLHQLGYRQLL